MSKSGVQNKKMIEVSNPMVAVTVTVVNIPRAAMMLQFDVNKEYGRADTEPDVLSVASFFRDVARGIKANHRASCEETG